jgi:AcrR family transcriptional regulator
MTSKSPDQRVQRTRKLLQEALFALILEKGYETVTVQDIIDRANVGRSTFYAHFLGKQQLFLSRFDEVRAFLTQQQVLASGVRYVSFSLGMFEHAQSHLHLYRALVGKQSGAIVVQHMKQMITELVCVDACGKEGIEDMRQIGQRDSGPSVVNGEYNGKLFPRSAVDSARQQLNRAIRFCRMDAVKQQIHERLVE